MSCGRVFAEHCADHISVIVSASNLLFWLVWFGTIGSSWLSCHVSLFFLNPLTFLRCIFFQRSLDSLRDLLPGWLVERARLTVIVTFAATSFAALCPFPLDGVGPSSLAYQLLAWVVTGRSVLSCRLPVFCGLDRLSSPRLHLPLRVPRRHAPSQVLVPLASHLLMDSVVRCSSSLVLLPLLLAAVVSARRRTVLFSLIKVFLASPEAAECSGFPRVGAFGWFEL